MEDETTPLMGGGSAAEPCRRRDEGKKEKTGSGETKAVDVAGAEDERAVGAEGDEGANSAAAEDEGPARPPP